MSNTYGIRFRNADGRSQYAEFDSSLSDSDITAEVHRAITRNTDVTVTDHELGITHTIPGKNVISIKRV